MRRSACAATCLAILGLATIASAQTRTPIAAPPEPTGTVTGHVFCSDTNQPARFAHVSLEAIPDPPKDPNPAAGASSKPKSPSPSAAVSLSGPPSSVSVETTLDGSFTLTKVKPGNYYVVVEKDGYIKPRDIFTKKQIEDPSPEMRALIASALPRVTVQSSHTEQAEVRLERGAAISGTILYDDGSPAAELSIKLLHKDATGKWVPLNASHFKQSPSTDDRGYFRVPSLLADDYMIEADLNLTDSKTFTNEADDEGHTMQFEMQNGIFSLSFYGAGFARLSQATGVKLHSGQELTGQDMTVPIAKLHKLTGRVAAGRDAHLVNAAKIALITRDDNKELSTAEISRDDGLFHFEFIPDGDYLLRVTNARDVVWDPPSPPTAAAPTMILSPFGGQDKERVLATYGTVDQPLLFSGDTLGVTVTIPPDAKPATTAAAAPN
jgi:hypothetical protein